MSSYINIAGSGNQFNEARRLLHPLHTPTDFLPLFVWVLVQCDFHRAEIEAEYMWGLAHPSLFTGEAGYYLTTLTTAGGQSSIMVSEGDPLCSGSVIQMRDTVQ